jgi:hypothetical protein
MSAPRPAPIEVIKVKPLDNGGNLKAFASVCSGPQLRDTALPVMRRLGAAQAAPL